MSEHWISCKGVYRYQSPPVEISNSETSSGRDNNVCSKDRGLYSFSNRLLYRRKYVIVGMLRLLRMLRISFGCSTYSTSFLDLYYTVFSCTLLDLYRNICNICNKCHFTLNITSDYCPVTDTFHFFTLRICIIPCQKREFPCYGPYRVFLDNIPAVFLLLRLVQSFRIQELIFC